MSKPSLALLEMGYIEHALAPDTRAWVIYGFFNLFTENLEAANLSHLCWLPVAKGGKKIHEKKMRKCRKSVGL